MKNISSRYEEKQAVSELKYGIIEVTSNCQCSCPGCYMVTRNALNKGEMALETAVKILDLCRDYLGKELETMDILGGEPLLWPYLKPYIDILLTRGITPWVFTNMLAITPALARWLYERDVYVTGKLNIDPDDECQLQMQADMLGTSLKTAEKMIKAIDIFTDAGYRNPKFRLQNLLRKKNIRLVPAYYRWCLKNDIGTDLEMMGSGEEVGLAYWAVAPRPEEIKDIIGQVQSVRKDFGLKPAEVLMPHIFGSCPFYDKGLFFAVDGHIRSCSNSTVRLGRITDKDGIKNAYESDLICNRLMLSKERVGEPCHSCEKWEKCRGGCRATVEGMGDPNGGYMLCPLH